jgi:hypothetical protein
VREGVSQSATRVREGVSHGQRLARFLKFVNVSLLYISLTHSASSFVLVTRETEVVLKQYAIMVKGYTK